MGQTEEILEVIDEAFATVGSSAIDAASEEVYASKFATVGTCTYTVCDCCSSDSVAQLLCSLSHDLVCMAL